MSQKGKYRLYIFTSVNDCSHCVDFMKYEFDKLTTLLSNAGISYNHVDFAQRSINSKTSSDFPSYLKPYIISFPMLILVDESASKGGNLYIYTMNYESVDGQSLTRSMKYKYTATEILRWISDVSSSNQGGPKKEKNEFKNDGSCNLSLAQSYRRQTKF